MAIEDFIPGTDRLLGSLGRFALKLFAQSGKVDSEAADDMVEGMRSTVAAESFDTGTLFNGIRTYEEDGSTVVEASAVRGDFDYSRAVEFGRHADSRFFGADSFGQGSGEAAAEPFFFPEITEALEARGQRMDEAIDIVSGQEDLS